MDDTAIRLNMPDKRRRQHMATFDSNWKQKVFSILGVIVECNDDELEFYSAAGFFDERDFEIEENIYESYSAKNAVLRILLRHFIHRQELKAAFKI